MRMLRLAWAALALGAGLAQAAGPHFESVAADKIPREAVGALAQDRAGFPWIATGDGLTRFDGLQLQPQELAEPKPDVLCVGHLRRRERPISPPRWPG